MIVKEKVHKHKWVPIPGLEKFAQRLCSCGAIAAPGGVRAGKNTVTINPPGTTDVIRWSSSAGSNVLGDLGMELSSGRNRIFIGGAMERYAATTEQDGGRKWCVNQDPNSSGTPVVVGKSALNTTLNGTAAVLNQAGDGQYISYTTAAVANSDGGWISTVLNETQRQFCPYFECFLNIGATITNLRIWIGLFSATPMATATPGASGIHCAAFRFDTGAGDSAQWRVVTSDGVSTNVKALDGTGGAAALAVAGGASYLFRIAFPLAGAAIFSGSQLAGTSFQTIPLFSTITNLPGSTTGIGPVAQTRTLNAAAKVFAISRWGVRQHAPVA